MTIRLYFANENADIPPVVQSVSTITGFADYTSIDLDVYNINGEATIEFETYKDINLNKFTTLEVREKYNIDAKYTSIETGIDFPFTDLIDLLETRRYCWLRFFDTFYYSRKITDVSSQALQVNFLSYSTNHDSPNGRKNISFELEQAIYDN